MLKNKKFLSISSATILSSCAASTSGTALNNADSYKAKKNNQNHSSNSNSQQNVEEKDYIYRILSLISFGICVYCLVKGPDIEKEKINRLIYKFERSNEICNEIYNNEITKYKYTIENAKNDKDEILKWCDIEQNIANLTSVCDIFHNDDTFKFWVEKIYGIKDVQIVHPHTNYAQLHFSLYNDTNKDQEIWININPAEQKIYFDAYDMSSGYVTTKEDDEYSKIVSNTLKCKANASEIMQSIYEKVIKAAFDCVLYTHNFLDNETPIKKALNCFDGKEYIEVHRLPKNDGLCFYRRGKSYHECRHKGCMYNIKTNIDKKGIEKGKFKHSCGVSFNYEPEIKVGSLTCLPAPKNVNYKKYKQQFNKILVKCFTNIKQELLLRYALTSFKNINGIAIEQKKNEDPICVNIYNSKEDIVMNLNLLNDGNINVTVHQEEHKMKYIDKAIRPIIKSIKKIVHGNKDFVLGKEFTLPKECSILICGQIKEALMNIRSSTCLSGRYFSTEFARK